MPLRLPLVAFHPAGPRPPQRRRVYCPGCRHGFDISRRAVTVRCPRCTHPLAFDDLQLDGRVDGDVTTMGHIELGPHSSVTGRLTCGALTGAGRLEGDTVVYGLLTLRRGARTRGQLTARAIHTEPGTHCEAHLRITPDPGPPPTPQPRTLERLQTPDQPRPMHGLPRVVPKR